jgi:hypothetical protein
LLPVFDRFDFTPEDELDVPLLPLSLVYVVPEELDFFLVV